MPWIHGRRRKQLPPRRGLCAAKVRGSPAAGVSCRAKALHGDPVPPLPAQQVAADRSVSSVRAEPGPSGSVHVVSGLQQLCAEEALFESRLGQSEFFFASFASPLQTLQGS